MKLELKHLAAYLPYGLIGTINDRNGVWKLMGTGMHGENIICANEFLSAAVTPIIEFKPAFRPLSDLGKQAPKTVSGIRFVDEINKPCMYMLDRHGDFYDLPESMEVADVYETFEGLFKYHFDVFGLIDAGLAIDINTLSNEKV